MSMVVERVGVDKVKMRLANLGKRKREAVDDKAHNDNED